MPCACLTTLLQRELTLLLCETALHTRLVSIGSYPLSSAHGHITAITSHLLHALSTREVHLLLLLLLGVGM